MKNQKQTFVAYFAIICALILTTVSTAAATFTVNTALDSHDPAPGDGYCGNGYGICSLRAAIEEANALAGEDHIQFSDSFKAPNPPKTIVLKFGSLSIESGMTISGPGARQLMVDGDQKSSVLWVGGGYNQVNISALTIQNGYAAVKNFPTFSPGVVNWGNNTRLSQVTVRNNIAIVVEAPGMGKSSGGGIGNFGGGTLTLVDSTVSGNKAVYGGGILNQGNLYVINSTISDNTSGTWGGGIFNQGAAWIRNTTITNNFTQTQPGGGIENPPAYYLQMANTIVANNSAPSDNDIEGNIDSLGNNLVRTRGSSSGYAASDLPNGTNPKLGALKNNGGPTNTRALISGSPAIDAGNDCVIGTPNCNGVINYDQRGLGFPRKFNRVVDIGAFEYQGEVSMVQIRGKVLTPDGRGLSNAVVTLTGANRESRTTQTDQYGNFSFDNVRTGEEYINKVESGQYNYDPQELFVTEERDDVIFVPAGHAEPPDTE